MYRFWLIIAALGFTAAGVMIPFQAEAKTGEELFKQHCVVCHADGGNVVNPKKTLHKKDLHANNIKSAKDIVKLMRKPGPGMTTFDEKTIPNDKANEIAAYILKKF